MTLTAVTTHQNWLGGTHCTLRRKLYRQVTPQLVDATSKAQSKTHKSTYGLHASLLLTRIVWYLKYSQSIAAASAD